MKLSAARSCGYCSATARMPPSAAVSADSACARSPGRAFSAATAPARASVTRAGVCSSCAPMASKAAAQRASLQNSRALTSIEARMRANSDGMQRASHHVSTVMVVMTPGATQEQVDAVVARLETTGVHVVVMPGELTTAIGAIGDPAGVAELGLEVMPGVDRLVPISRPFKLAGRELGEREHSVVDVIQVGARNMQNYGLLQVVGRLGKPVLLKRGLSSTLEELLQAADYILKEGNEQVILCERGIRTFETATRFTLDLSAIPWLKLHSHLPVIVDPSHAAGDRRLVGPLSRAAAAVGADGLIVEIAEDPEVALCDGPQQLSAAAFAAYAADVYAHAELLGKTLA